jgi:hypothetical protein
MVKGSHTISANDTEEELVFDCDSEEQFMSHDLDINSTHIPSKDRDGCVTVMFAYSYTNIRLLLQNRQFL